MTDLRRSLVSLQNRGDFTRRHIGPGAPEIAQMLEAVGYDTLEALTEKAVPKAIRIVRSATSNSLSISGRIFTSSFAILVPPV